MAVPKDHGKGNKEGAHVPEGTIGCVCPSEPDPGDQSRDKCCSVALSEI